MKTILPANEIVKNLLRKAESADAYRFMSYVVSEKTDGGVLLFHTLTRELLLLTDEEAERSFDMPELYEKWFIVPEDTDDRKLADQVRFVLCTLKPKLTNIISYSIFTTTDCNARCAYCYEKGARRRNMNRETALRLVDFIEKHCGGESIKICWFGGEPLCNMPAIDTIADGLRERSVRFHSLIVTNAYLLDGDTVRKAKDRWGLKEAQITLDGTEKLYNRTKAYIYSGGNPFETVLENIGHCINNGISVSVRVNVSAANADDLPALAELLRTRFGESKYLRVYSQLINQIIGRADDEAVRINEKKRRFDALLRAYKLQNSLSLPRGPKLHFCTADTDHCITVLPDGMIGACEQYLDSDHIGSIWTDTVDVDARKPFREYVEVPECDSCCLYPECRILKKCEPISNCGRLYRENKLDDLKYQIRETMRFTQ